MARRAGLRTPLPLPTDDGEIYEEATAKALLYRDQWIAQCPFCGQDYQLVWPDELYFLCAGCWNEHGGGRYVRIDLPERWRGVDLHAALVTVRDQRNWLPAYDGHEWAGLLVGLPTQTADEVIEEFKGASIAGESIEELEAGIGL